MALPSIQVIRETESVCPHCLKTVSATIFERGEEVFMQKTCLDHGDFEVYLWPDADRYRWFSDFAFPTTARKAQTDHKEGCPHDCGLCPAHKRRITLPEIEVTWRCNLDCPVCFMFDGDRPPDPSLEQVRRMFETIQTYDGPDVPVQITGGEPTVRADLPEILRIGRETGFEVMELNTNGLAIGQNVQYLRELKKAGLTNVYLQFDGLDPEATRKLRGRDVLPTKLQAIQNCREEGIPVILAVTIVEGVNDTELGEIVRFAMANLDVVHGVALQPAFVSGRFDVPNPRHLSVGDVARLLSEQTDGRIAPSDIWPVGCIHPLCSGSTFLVGEGDDYEPFTRGLEEAAYRKNFDNTSPQGSVFLDVVAEMSSDGELPRGLPLLIMEYMDAWTMDLERARECNLAVTVMDGTSIPFCVYHLTDTNGKRLYPHGGKEANGGNRIQI